MNRQQTIGELRRLADTLEALPSADIYNLRVAMHMSDTPANHPDAVRMADALKLTERVERHDRNGRPFMAIKSPLSAEPSVTLFTGPARAAIAKATKGGA